MKVLPVMRTFKIAGIECLRRDGSIVVDDKSYTTIIQRRPAGLDGLPSTRINRVRKGPSP